MLSAYDVAQWFLHWADEEEEGITNLKVQKLLYFAQGHYLDYTDGTPLFSESMEAWAHGPVIPALYHELKHNGKSPIEYRDDDFSWDNFSEDQHDLLQAIWNTYGKYTAWKLREISHAQKPWKDHFVPNTYGTTIPWSSLREQFRGTTNSIDD